MALKRLPDVEISEEEAERVASMQDQADKDLDPDRGSTMIAIRWGRRQLRLVRSAAALRGVPYQVYIRNAAWEAAARDLERQQRLAPSR